MSPPAFPAVLACRNLHAALPGGERLQGVGFGLAHGEVLGVMGPTGAGVRLLLDVLSGLHRPTGGDAWVLGRPVALGRAGRLARAGLARTFAEPGLSDGLTPMQLAILAHRLGRGPRRWGRLLLPLGWMRGDERREAFAVLAFVGLGAVADRPLAALSARERRLADLARALVRRPAVLLLDHPFAGLAANGRAHVATLIRMLAAEGMTLLLADGDMAALAGLAARVVVLDDGRLIADGPPAEVGEDPAVLRAFTGEAEA